MVLLCLRYVSTVLEVSFYRSRYASNMLEVCFDRAPVMFPSALEVYFGRARVGFDSAQGISDRAR